MDKFRPIIISGPSGSGKDTIIKLLISRNKNIHDALGYTTREPRDGEKMVERYFLLLWSISKV